MPVDWIGKSFITGPNENKWDFCIPTQINDESSRVVQISDAYPQDEADEKEFSGGSLLFSCLQGVLCKGIEFPSHELSVQRLIKRGIAEKWISRNLSKTFLPTFGMIFRCKYMLSMGNSRIHESLRWNLLINLLLHPQGLGREKGHWHFSKRLCGPWRVTAKGGWLESKWIVTHPTERYSRALFVWKQRKCALSRCKTASIKLWWDNTDSARFCRQNKRYRSADSLVCVARRSSVMIDNL